MSEQSPLSLGTEDIKKLLMRYAVPAIVAMTAASLYNMMDSIFIGHGVGALGIAGLAVTFPFINLAAAFGLPVEAVSVKATTEEGLGFTGTGQGISAQAITLLTEVDNYCYDREMTAQTGCGGCCPGGGCGR